MNGSRTDADVERELPYLILCNPGISLSRASLRLGHGCQKLDRARQALSDKELICFAPETTIDDPMLKPLVPSF